MLKEQLRAKSGWMRPSELHVHFLISHLVGNLQKFRDFGPVDECLIAVTGV